MDVSAFGEEDRDEPLYQEVLDTVVDRGGECALGSFRFLSEGRIRTQEAGDVMLQLDDPADPEELTGVMLRYTSQEQMMDVLANPSAMNQPLQIRRGTDRWVEVLEPEEIAGIRVVAFQIMGVPRFRNWVYLPGHPLSPEEALDRIYELSVPSLDQGGGTRDAARRSSEVASLAEYLQHECELEG